MKESKLDIPPPATPVIIQLYEDLGEQLLDIVEEKCGDHRIVSGVCPNLTEAKLTADGKNAGKSLRKTGRLLSTESTECKLPSIEGGFPQKIKPNDSINADLSSSHGKKPVDIPSESVKIKFNTMEGNFSPRTRTDKKTNASKLKTTAQVTAGKPKGGSRVGETLPKITVTSEATNNSFKGGCSVRTRQLQNVTSKKRTTEKTGTHLNVSVSNAHLEDKCNTVNQMSRKMTKSLDKHKHVSPRGSVKNNNLSEGKPANVTTTPHKKVHKSNDLKSDVKTSHNITDGSKDKGYIANVHKNNAEKKEQEVHKKKTQEVLTKKAEHSKEGTESKDTKHPELNKNMKDTESGSVLEKKENTKTNDGIIQPRDNMKKTTGGAHVEKRWNLEVDTSRFTQEEHNSVPSESTVEHKDASCTSKHVIFKKAPSTAKLDEENAGDKENTKQKKSTSTKPTNKAKSNATKDVDGDKTGRDTPKQKKNLRLCEVVKKGDKSVPKYKDIHQNVKEKKHAKREALEVTSMQCEELKEANMYLTKILGMEKNARTIQLIDQLQRHQKTLEAELEEARRKETHAQERAEKAEKHVNEISQQVEQVRRSRDKTLSEKEHLMKEVEKERKAFEKVRQHVDSVGKMRQRAHQVKENALRQRNKLAQEIEAERAKMSAMLLAMKEVNTQKFNAERRRLNMVRMKNKLAKERDEERGRLRDLHDTIEEMKKEKDEAVKQKYRALKQRDEARTACRKLNGELKELRESVESLNESGCYVLETSERLTVMENTRRSRPVTNKRNPRSTFPSIDNKCPQRVLKSKAPHPGVSKTKNPAKLPKINQAQGAVGTIPSPVRGGFPTVHRGRPVQYDQWSPAYSHDVTENDVRGGAEFYDWGFYDDDHLPQPDLTRSYIQYADLQATGHQRALVNRPPHGGQWKKYPTGETLAPHSRLPTLSDNGFHSNADVTYEESDFTTSTTESGGHGNTVDRQVSAHLQGQSSDPRAHVTDYHGNNMIDRQVSAHLCHLGCRTHCDCARNNFHQSESAKLPMIERDQLYRPSAINSSKVDRIKFPEL